MNASVEPDISGRNSAACPKRFPIRLVGLTALIIVVQLAFCVTWLRPAAAVDRDWIRPPPADCAAAGKYPPVIGRSYPGDTHPTDKQQQWAMASCAQLFSFNRDCHDILGGETNGVAEERASLRKWWGVENRCDLLGALEGLEAGGQRRLYDEWVQSLDGRSARDLRRLSRQAALNPDVSNRLDVVLATRERFARTSLAGWDYARYVALCRWGFRVRYLTEDEAWTRIMPVARLLQETFPSWEALADNYTEGRRFWSLKQTEEDAVRVVRHGNYLRWNLYSPWQRLPWNTSLLPTQRRDDGAAEFRLGRAQFFCFGDPDGDEAAGKRAGTRLFHAAAAKGNVDAMYMLGACYRDGEGVEKSLPEAYRWFHQAASLGDGLAQYEVGMLYYWGRGVVRNAKQSAAWAFQAMTNGAGPVAETYVGWCYEEGFGTTKCMSNAIALYRSAAGHGEPWALANLGECYAKGNGVPKDTRQAASLFAASARGEYVSGMYRWGQFLESGEAGVTNRAAAIAWYRRAAADGERRAKRRLTELGEPEKAAPAR